MHQLNSEYGRMLCCTSLKDISSYLLPDVSRGSGSVGHRINLDVTLTICEDQQLEIHRQNALYVLVHTLVEQQL